MLRVGMVGWRGMVGSVLLDRMQSEGDFAHIEPTFFSTSNAGGDAPALGQSGGESKLMNAADLVVLGQMDVVLTCQGGEWTQAIYPQLRATGWQGIWIDAVSYTHLTLPTKRIV